MVGVATIWGTVLKGCRVVLQEGWEPLLYCKANQELSSLPGLEDILTYTVSSRRFRKCWCTQLFPDPMGLGLITTLIYPHPSLRLWILLPFAIAVNSLLELSVALELAWKIRYCWAPFAKRLGKYCMKESWSESKTGYCGSYDDYSFLPPFLSPSPSQGKHLIS